MPPVQSAAERVLQVHPLGRCNLACAHCYSSSSPHAGQQLPPKLLEEAVPAAAQHGYETLAVSGGEPLLYRALPELIAAARAAGMHATATTNGTLLDRRRLARAAGLDLLAISVDGPPEAHDRMRGAGAFARMARHLDGVRASGVPFGFAFTLTQHNLHQLDWVAAFAVEQGAALLQVHPLELAGRARAELPAARPDAEELQWAVVEVLRLRDHLDGRLAVHIDALPVGRMREWIEDDGSFAGAVRTLVVEADGTVVPLSHGFDRRWSLGRLQDAPLEQLIARFEPRLPALRMKVLQPASRTPAGARFVSWYETVATQARAATA